MEELIEEFPDDTTPADMEECVNNEDYDEKEKTVDNINEDVIHRDITENEKETNWVTLEKLIEEFPYDTSPV